MYKSFVKELNLSRAKTSVERLLPSWEKILSYFNKPSQWQTFSKKHLLHTASLNLFNKISPWFYNSLHNLFLAQKILPGMVAPLSLAVILFIQLWGLLGTKTLIRVNRFPLLPPCLCSKSLNNLKMHKIKSPKG